jgi:hypothetical protein
MQAQPDHHATSLVAIFNAKYGIEQLKTVPKEYVFYLRGTLACLRCIPDYVLQEFNEELNLGIPLDEWMDRASFRSRAEKTLNARAMRFIEEYEKEWHALTNDDVVKAVLGRFGERYLLIHRKPRIMEVQQIAPNANQMYESVGESTQHFINGKDGSPSKDDIPGTLEYVLEKVSSFRGNLVFRSYEP